MEIERDDLYVLLKIATTLACCDDVQAVRSNDDRGSAYAKQMLGMIKEISIKVGMDKELGEFYNMLKKFGEAEIKLIETEMTSEAIH